MDVDDNKNNVKSVENDVLSIVITKLYRLLYESIQLKLFLLKNIKITLDKEYKSIINQLNASISNNDYDDAKYIDILKFLHKGLNNSVTTINDLLELVETTLVSANKHDQFIYGSPLPQVFRKSQEWKKKEADKLNPSTRPAKLQERQDNLARLAEDDSIDACMFEILKFKLDNGHDDNNYSAKVLCDHLRQSGGWYVDYTAAIHFVIKNVHSLPITSEYRDYKTKQKEEKKKKKKTQEKNSNSNSDAKERDDTSDETSDSSTTDGDDETKYVSKMIENRYLRHFLLLEILLREGTSTKLLTKEKKYNYDVQNIFDFVFDGYVSRDYISDDRRDSIRHKIIDLIFEYGVDVDVNQYCRRTVSTNHTEGRYKWNPIHTAVKNKDCHLSELIIKHGGNIDEYEKKQSTTDGSLKYDSQTISLFSACDDRWWAYEQDAHVKLFKSMLLACSKYNVFPNVNLLNKYVRKKQKTRDRVLREKIALAKKNNIKTWKLEKELETFLNNEKNGKARIYHSWREWSDVENPDEKTDESKKTKRRFRYFRNLSVRTKYQLTCYETAIHAAVAKCNIDVVKLLLIYGCDTSMKSIKVYWTTLANIDDDKDKDRRRSSSEEDDKDLSSVFKDTYDKFLKLYENGKDENNDDGELNTVGKEADKKQIVLDQYESVETVYQILERVDCKDNSIKIQIKNLLHSNNRWFPDLIDYYPKYMQLCIEQIIDSLKMTHSIPIEIVNIVVCYFYDFSDCLKQKKTK